MFEDFSAGVADEFFLLTRRQILFVHPFFMGRQYVIVIIRFVAADYVAIECGRFHMIMLKFGVQNQLTISWEIFGTNIAMKWLQANRAEYKYLYLKEFNRNANLESNMLP